MIEKNQKLNELISKVKEGHVDLAPGIHLSALVADQHTPENIGQFQARFSSDNEHLDVTVRINDDGSPDIFFNANEGFDPSTILEVSDIDVARLVGKTIMANMYGDKNFSTIDGALLITHDLVNNFSEDMPFGKIKSLFIRLNSEVGLTLNTLDKDDEIFVLSNDESELVHILDFLNIG